MYTYTLSLDDVVTYNQYLLSQRKPDGRKTVRYIFSAYLVVMGLVSIYIESYALGGILICIAAVYPLLIGLLMKWSITKAFKKAILSDCSGMINSPIDFGLTQEHIIITDQGGTLNYKLSSVEAVIEIEDYFFIRISNSHVIIIPRSFAQLSEAVQKMIVEHQLNHIIKLGWKY